jgi:ubiquinone/menaquinone biosynthesis C-methylase UbiE
MNTENFTGRAQAYTNARPGYPDETMEYIRKLVPADAVFADIGAGTGKFTALLARYGHKIFAVEPNADMREQLTITLASFPNTKIVNGSAEATTLPDHSIDVIICAQALNWFDIHEFRAECQRIGKPNPIVITLFNYKHDETHGISRYKKSTDALYRNPIVREFLNPVFFTRDKWLLYFLSMAGIPQASDSGYEAHIAKMNEIFDRDNVDGLLCLDLVTKVYSERINKI